MTSQDMHTQGEGSQNHIDNGYKGSAVFLLLLADHQLDDSQQQRQPGSGSDDHGKDDANQEKGAELVGDAGDEGWETPHTQHPAKENHEHPGQPEL